MARTFNMGIGMVLVVSPDAVDIVQSLVAISGDVALAIGTVQPGTQKAVITGLESVLLSSYMSWAIGLPKEVTPAPKPKKRRVGILLSGTGTNMEALVAFARDPKNDSAADIVVVVSNIASAVGVEKARALGIATEVLTILDRSNMIVSVMIRIRLDEFPHQHFASKFFLFNVILEVSLKPSLKNVGIVELASFFLDTTTRWPLIMPGCIR